LLSIFFFRSGLVLSLNFFSNNSSVSNKSVCLTLELIPVQFGFIYHSKNFPKSKVVNDCFEDLYSYSLLNLNINNFNYSVKFTVSSITSSFYSSICLISLIKFLTFTNILPAKFFGYSNKSCFILSI